MKALSDKKKKKNLKIIIIYEVKEKNLKQFLEVYTSILKNENKNDFKLFLLGSYEEFKE